MATVQVRYIVNDVDAAIAFYCQHLGFKEVMHPAPVFAMLTRCDLRLVLSAPNPSQEEDNRCPMASNKNQAAGTDSPSKYRISRAPATICARPESGSAMNS